MQITTSKSPSKKTIVDNLMDIGYSKEKAVNLYNKYKGWGKLGKLEEYVAIKMSISSKYDSIPLRDM